MNEIPPLTEAQATLLQVFLSSPERPKGSSPIPPGCEIRPQAIDNLAADAPLSQWAVGFSMGYDYLVESWNEYTPEEFDEELGSVLMVLTFFSSPKLAKAYHKEGTGERSLSELADTVVTLFPEAMRAFAYLGRSIYQVRYEAGDFAEPPPISREIGRNDPCPCGSGKKFKKCCGLN